MAKYTRDDIYKAAKELSNWGRWGPDDQIGTLNNVSPEDVVRAAGLIRKGKARCIGGGRRTPFLWQRRRG